jgi:Domain of unknown function (DUF222)
MSLIRHSLETAGAALERASSLSEGVDGETDDELVACTTLIESLSRRLDVIKLRHASELARRSSPEMGSSGLAARHGSANAANFLRDLTKSSFREAARRIRVGTTLAADSAGPTGAGDEIDEPAAAGEETSGVGGASDGSSLSPFAAITRAVSDGELGTDAADRVMGCLQPIVGVVEPASLVRATEALAVKARTSNADELAALARSIRDALDRVGIADRERDLKSRRSFRKGAVVNGLRRVWMVLDPESDALLSGAIDAAMSPRLGGPRFADPLERERSNRLTSDERTNEQIALDVIIELVRLGSDRDTGTLLGATKPGVRVTIAYEDLIKGLEGQPISAPGGGGNAAWLEGHPEPLSAATARRLLCENGALPIVLGGDSIPLDVGRTRRLFNGAQRVALAVRDGGCRWPGCDRPPSWSEAHHIDPFALGGATDLADGILLCRRHHLILHNNGWQIRRDDARYWLRPPPRLDRNTEAIEMPSKSPVGHST